MIIGHFKLNYNLFNSRILIYFLAEKNLRSTRDDFDFLIFNPPFVGWKLLLKLYGIHLHFFCTKLYKFSGPLYGFVTSFVNGFICNEKLVKFCWKILRELLLKKKIRFVIFTDNLKGVTQNERNLFNISSL